MIITIAHSKGGVGKSLLSWHLAIAMKVPIVDLDFQKTLVYTNNIRKANKLKPLDIIHPKSQEEFIGLFDDWPEDKNIIIDVGGFDSNLNRMALYISDFIITPAVDRVTEIAGLSKFHQIVSELSKKMKVDINTNVLLNDVNPVAKDFSIMEELIDNYEHFNLMDTIVSHRADFYRTMEEGKGVTELESGKAKKEIKKLIKEIIKKGEENGKAKN
ncbi:MAG: plasmid partitioning protein [SAR324 cluster bacterium]|uniref:Plasmid partitioning protein n=1 Tax=SAR324 cluster bacterium TaxID=2024889 RepID=A0A2A4T4Y5_9DELT|nr:MAG: plasmid partitioning protein [SAR324 cluster bacterium]